MLQEDTGVTLPAELAVMLGRLERELRAGAVSAESEAWLAQCGLTAEQMAAQWRMNTSRSGGCIFTTVTTVDCRRRSSARKAKRRGAGEYDEWGTLLGNPHHLHQSVPFAGAAV